MIFTLRKTLYLIPIILILGIATAVNASSFDLKQNQIEVVSLTGTTSFIDPANQPILFFAPWCHSCDDVLKEIGQIPQDKRPILVGVLLRDKNDVQSSIDKAKKAGLEETIYFTDHDPGCVPALLTKDNHYIKETKAICDYLKGGSN